MLNCSYLMRVFFQLCRQRMQGPYVSDLLSVKVFKSMSLYTGCHEDLIIVEYATFLLKKIIKDIH